MIYSCDVARPPLPGYNNEGLVVKVVRTASREVTMWKQLAALPRVRILPLMMVIPDIAPGLSALVAPRAERLLVWASRALTARAVVPTIAQLMQVSVQATSNRYSSVLISGL